MSIEYNNYIAQHKENVKKGYEFIKDHIPELLGNVDGYFLQLSIFSHDDSKYDRDEYSAYDAYFYGGNKSFEVVNNFNRAWLNHIHKNPHHWQHWILINDDPNEGEIIMDMPYTYIIEMVCDWWAFSWQKGNLYEIFEWYDEHKEYIKLSFDTRVLVEHILKLIKETLDAEKKNVNN